jgi:drug/metabolite transporter (DMT)-like permease
MLWTIAAGALFSVLSVLLRALGQGVPPLQSQFLRYAMGLAVLLPIVLHRGFRNYRTLDVPGQFWRGAAHTTGLALWFVALPHIPLADTVAISFTTPLFVMVGAALIFGEPMRWERWVAALAGFAGVLIVVAPALGWFGAGAAASGTGGGFGYWHLVMLAAAPAFAASFLITKALTRRESAGVILVWQSITVALLSLPVAIVQWQSLNAWQWGGFVLCGLFGSVGHYCLTRSFAAADLTATQSAKFLDLLWAALLGYLVFGDRPTETTLFGGAVIAAATLWLARRESRARF